jgi:hypothetical protein
MRMLAIILGTLFLVGCHTQDVLPSSVPFHLKAQANNLIPEDRADLIALARDPRRMRRLISDSTMRSWDRFHGTQIEYHSPDGRTWLAYPGNSGPVRGEWELRASTGNPYLCYRYGTNSYNPATGRAGGNWNCQEAISYFIQYDVFDGDVLNLEKTVSFSRRIPAKINLSVNDVRGLFGLSKTRTSKKIEWRKIQ